LTGSLLVVTGPPGAGKSTVARVVADRFEPSVLVIGDRFFGFLCQEIAPWFPEAHRQNAIVTDAAAAAAGRYVAGGYTTVFDGIVGPWFLPAFRAGTGLEQLAYVILLPAVDVCVERVRTRADHGFDDEPATRKMHAEFARAEIADRHVVADPPASADAVADLVAARWDEGSLNV
jgi:predicted ABC-type ATPase